ncbi:MAG: Bax inhibitor-1/YccA family protein [Planctomycetaceae bacterium]
MRSSNPVLTDSVFQNFEDYGDSTTMTVTGTAVKTLIALVLAFLTAGFVWFKFEQLGGANAGPQAFEAIMPWLLGGLVVGLVTSLATMFKPNWAAYTTPVYALAEGCFLGGLSAVVQSQFPDVPIVFQALGLTFGTAFAMMTLYQTGMIQVTEKLRAGVMAATGAIALLYLVSFALSFFGVQVPYIHGSGPIGIGFSLFVVGLAAFNLLLDFDLIERLAAQRAPKHMEWYGAFALMVTLVWLYIEILRLLSKLNRRR